MLKGICYVCDDSEELVLISDPHQIEEALNAPDWHLSFADAIGEIRSSGTLYSNQT